MQQNYFSEEDYEFINKTLVPVRSAGAMTVVFDDKSDPEIAAVVQIDTSNRPDIGDLARVVRSEGIGQKGQIPPFRYTMGKDNAAMIVSITMTDPVECTFTFVVKYPQHKDFFYTAAEREFFYLTVGELTLQNSIGLRIPHNELSEVIKVWESES